MLFSWNQLTDYLHLTIRHEEVADRLSLVGFNHESTHEVGGDLCIDLEITSNRPDCLSHLGIAREIALLLGQSVSFPSPVEPSLAPAAQGIFSVENQVPDLCSRFEAITLVGTGIGKSPTWLARRIETLGFRSINNVVDVTNYVMAESGQPIHAYDLKKLEGQTLVIRTARKGEVAEAINHQRYELDPSVLVIADQSRVVSLAGVMGCTNSEISSETSDIVIETARFDPMNIRRTSRALGLQSQSSYRFERPIDPEMVLWARNRCVELIQTTGGGTVGTSGSFAGARLDRNPTVTLRVAQVARLLGIEIPVAEMKRILGSLGLVLRTEDPASLSFDTPVWRSDLTREVDLIEEVARIHDYDKIPEDRPVTLGPIREDRRGRIEGEVRTLLNGLGFFEAITYSFVAKPLVGGEFLATASEPIRVEHATRKQANLMRQSLVPSLLEVASDNEARGNFGVRLFEVANVYQAVPDQKLPNETTRLAIVAPGDFFATKGVVEAIGERLHSKTSLRWTPKDFAGLRPGHSAEIRAEGVVVGFAGEVDSASVSRLKLRGEYSVLEIAMDYLDATAEAIPQQAPVPIFPGVQRDLSLVVSTRTTWESIEAAVTQVVDSTFEGITFLDSFRGGNLAKDEQSVHFGLRFRNLEKTMTSEEIDAQMARIINQCQTSLGATIRS